MHKAQHFLDSVSSRTSGSYLYQLLSLMGFVILLLVSSSVFALEIKPGSNAICSAGATKGFLSKGSYNSLISSYRNESYQTVISQTTRTGSTNANIPLKIKMSINDVGINNTGNNTTITGTTDNPAIDINRNFIRQTSRSDISLEFQDSDNGKVIYLNKVAVSVFDIDKNVSRGRGWDDLVKITGVNENNEPIKGRLQTISTSKVIDENGLQTSSTSNLNCRDALDSECQGSVLFDEPVKSVTLSYGNTNNVTSPTTQRIQFRLDSYCYKPPKIIVNKLLDGSRVDGDDQFRIELQRTDNNDFVEAFTTTGSNDVVTDNTTTVTTLTEGVNYTVSEHIINGNLLDYQTTYVCSNATTGTDVVFSSGNMPVNEAGTRRTFAINNVSYGDEITCNVTNTPSQYTFSGTVFNDNGGISSEDKFDTSSTFTGNSSYFNGQFDSSIESGVSHPDLKVSLNDCNGSIIDATNSPNPQSIPFSGQYSFIVKTDKLPNNNTVCITEIEPDPWNDYPVDTTPNEYEFTLKSGVFNYKTGVQDNAGNTLNLDFGEVIKNQSALVLIKSQYVHNCNINTNFNGTTSTPSQTPAFSTAEIKDIEPGKCIAYRIEAYNRGHVDLKDIQINDQLQVKSQTNLVTSVFALPVPKGDPTSLYTGTTLPTGTITSELFNLNKPTGSTPTKATLYFNTKYGTTMDTQ